jgi:hypothetical protein
LSFIHARLSITAGNTAWSRFTSPSLPLRTRQSRANTMDLSMDDASVFDEFDDSDNFEPVPIVSLSVSMRFI